MAAVIWVRFGAAQDLFVDNDAGAPGYAETGTWTTTSNIGAGYNGGSYRHTSFTSPASTATWRPSIPVTGYYEVSVIFRCGADRTSNAPYTINHADGASTASVDQTGSFSGALGMVNIGTHRFLSGTSGNVVLRNNGGTGNYIADTVRFRPNPPPVITGSRVTPLYPQGGEGFWAMGTVTDNVEVQSVRVDWSASPSATAGSAMAFDDGLHMDGAAGDSLYGAALPGFATSETVTLRFVAMDNNGAPTTGPAVRVVIGAATLTQLRINEIVASNTGSAFDPDFGDTGDWVELYNTGPDAADLTSLTLSDSAGNPTKWLFPAGSSVPADSYLLVWCDNQSIVDNAFHTNFALSAGGETVVLYDTRSATVVDQIVFPALGADEAYARFPDGSGVFVKTIITTPNAANQIGQRGDAPVFSAVSGLYSSPMPVSISAPDATEIRYTIGGADPTKTSTQYTVALAVSATTVLRARAYYAAPLNPSLISSASYLYDTAGNRTIPSLNLIMDPKDLFDPATGIYTNYNARGDDWERPGHAVLVNPDGSVMRESGVGVRINGGSSRGLAKKSFRLYLRASYGQSSWTLPWLTRTTAPSFNNLVLRGNNNDGILNSSTAQIHQVTFFRDQMMRHWHGDTGALGIDGFFCALYLNGQYWGLYNPCERVTDNYMESKAGGADWDVVKGTWDSTLKYNTEVLDGDLVEWNNFLAWLDASDLSVSTGLAALQQRIDYNGFLKYFSLNIAGQNEDWPQNNWIATRRRGDPTAKWVFHENDAEWALGLRPQGWASDTLTWAQGNNFMISPSHNHKIAPLSKLFNGNDFDPNHTTTINGILDNAQGRKDFISAMEEILNFEFSPLVSIPKLNSYEALIRTEVPRESARWAANMIITASAFNTAWPAAAQNMRDFLTNRPAQVRTLMNSKFSIAGTRTIAFEKAGSGSGKLRIYDRDADLPWTGTFFDSSVLHLSGLAATGSQFTGWSGAITTSPVSLDYSVATGAATTITLSFGPAVASYAPNDVIINEYWVNDNGTIYPGVPGGIQGSWVELLVVRRDVDLRGWRITNNPTLGAQGTVDDGDGSLILPGVPGLASVPAGTVVLIIPVIHATNTASFPADDLDPSDRRLVFYRGNGNLDATTDPGFSIGTGNAAVTLLAPGPSVSFVDDVGVDFIAEGSAVTPLSFFGATATAVLFPTPFSGIGNDDGAFFTNDALGGFNNDNGSDPNNNDAIGGPGGWVVDAPSGFTGDSSGSVNILTPGAPNTGQNVSSLVSSDVDTWGLY